MNTLKASLKMFLFLVCVAIAVPLQMLVLAVHKGNGAYIIPKLWHKSVCALFGIRYKIHGTPYKDGQVIYASNHLSYLDIPLIGSLLPASFLAKSEVAGWPLFGFLAKLQQTEFIRRDVMKTKDETEALNARITKGRNLIIFPEGTSTDGQSVWPFKTSLFSLVFNSGNPDLRIQPMTVKVLTTDGRAPLTQDDRDLYAWHVKMDTELHVHLWRFAKTSGARLALIFHEPVLVSDFSDRKTLAKQCHDSVSKGLDVSVAQAA